MTANIWEVDEEALNKQIFKEFNKSQEDLLNDIDIMREWVKTQPHFPEEPSNKLLRMAILLNKWSIEKAKKQLDMYYTIKTVMPEAYKYVPLSPRMILHSKVFYWVPLPKHTPDFKRIIYTQYNPNYGPEYFEHDQCVEYLCNLQELLIDDDSCYSYHFIMDFKGVQLGHVSKINPMVFRKLLILSEVTVHSDSDILLEVFGKTAMPKDIGGEERSLEELTDCILKKFEERKKRFETLRTLRVDESLRPQKLVNDDVLGYYGSFKAINVD